MIAAVMVLGICLPAGAACGKIFARQNDMGNENLHAALAAVLPPYGAFCAINLLMKD